ncbi:MAG: amidohydrolase family protein [Bryobacteraceae bacterium]
MTTPRIVDAHMHLGAPGTLFTFGWELADILRLMDRLGIDRAYSMHHNWLAGHCEEARTASLEAFEKSGGRLPFLAVHNPNEENESLHAMNACLGHEGFIGIKIHPSFHGLSADDERYESIWDYATEHRLPILSHTWSETYNPVQKLSQPMLFEKYIASYPRVAFVMGHCGGPGAGRGQAIHLAQKYPNVYLDIAGDIFSLGLVPELVQAVGAHKVLFGSDMPWIDPRARLGAVLLANLDDTAKTQILGQNAMHVFEPRLVAGERLC